MLKNSICICVYSIYMYTCLCEGHEKVYGMIIIFHVYAINKQIGNTFFWFQCMTHMNAKRITDYTQDPEPQYPTALNMQT